MSRVASLSYNAVAGICVFQHLIRMVCFIHLYSESSTVKVAFIAVLLSMITEFTT